jgi:transposase
MTISELTAKSRDEVQRFEIFTGAGRRRGWDDDEKARIVAESYGSGETVSGVARRHGLSPQQLFTWRRLARRKTLSGEAGDALEFAPVVVKAPGSASSTVGSCQDEAGLGGSRVVEIETGAGHVWIWRGADPRLVSTIIRALKGEP